MVDERSVWKKIGPKSGMIKELPQTPKTRKSIVRDASRKARAPGLRLSKSGNKYWETRENRSDKKGSRL